MKYGVMAVKVTKMGIRVSKYTQYGIKKYRRQPNLGNGEVWPGAAAKIQKWQSHPLRPTNIIVRHYDGKQRQRPGWLQIHLAESFQATAIHRQIDMVYRYRRHKKRYHRHFIELIMALNGVEVV